MIRDRIRGEGPCLRGTFHGIPDPIVTEILCASGAEFLCIDGEHAAIRGSALANILRAAQCYDTPALVRVPDCVPHLIAEALDAGAAGIVVPRVSTTEAARQAVFSAKFPPAGHRGVGPGRAAAYGYRIAQLLDSPQPLIGIQIETQEALECLPQILSVEGLDFVMIGPGDLGVSLRATEAEIALEAAIDMIFDVAQQIGLPCGIFVPDRDTADKEAARARFVVQGSDAMMLASAAGRVFSGYQR